MSNQLLLGPILGLESDTLYTTLVVTDDTVSSVLLEIHQDTLSFELVGTLHVGRVWRVEFDPHLEPNSCVNYRILIENEFATSKSGDSQWSFHVPAQTETPKLAYASCNGFSDFKLMTSTERPYALWQAMSEQHDEAPFSLLLMGGDQIYADSIWTMVPSLKQWNELPREKKIKAKANKQMKAQIRRFYSELYLDRWNKPDVAKMLASIPSIMMWDDHDIFDGWGSYPEDIQTCEVYSAIFAEAKNHFDLLQLRSANKNSTLLRNASANANQAEVSHFGAVVRFKNYQILVLDNRSERTLNSVMSEEHWQDVIHFLDNCTTGDLLVMTGVPVVYRDFSFAERAVDATPWEEEVTDDLKDHWRAKEHEGERSRLIMRLLANAKRRQGKTVLLSGDVHVGALGIIRDESQSDITRIHQVISSGIVHPSPTFMQWLGICALTNDDDEYLDGAKHIVARMIKPTGGDKYIRTRNFTTLKMGTDHKIWVNWIIEGKDKPVYAID
ncbi:alkaline phosphatase D family protein [Pseudoalteromonas xiamenensis]|uniref:alkaline phosphatase D family protein n=1 Tax=Pseudoalteromonas xiamenensis TaxID=882626 RepID=UPI0035EBAB21